MPEVREILSHYLMLMFILMNLLLPTGTRVHDLWFDSDDDKNEPTSDWHGRHLNGMVGPLRPQKNRSNPVRMGSALWPSDDMDLARLRTLHIAKIEWNHRCLFLKFVGSSDAELWMGVRFYTHTSIQAYSRKEWFDDVALTRKKNRGFRIQFAIEFNAYVLAFVSQDRLCQISWGKSRNELPGGSWPNMLDDWPGYLTTIIQWRRESIQKQKHETRTTNHVVDVLKGIRASGIGVYTDSEILHLSGLPPYLSESALFDEPPRLARFLECQYYFVRKFRDEIYEELVAPCIHDGLLAPDLQQRLRYERKLRVHGKSRVKVSERQQELIKAYKKSPRRAFDFWEPAFVGKYMWDPGHLGHLIFGDHASVVAPPDWKEADEPDPLTLEFFPHKAKETAQLAPCPTPKLTQRFLDEWFPRRRPAGLEETGSIGALTAATVPQRSYDTFDTHLDLSLYTSYESTFGVKPSKYCDVYAARSKNKDFWTVIPVPQNLLDQDTMTEYSFDEQATLLFKYIVTETRLFAVGPLEYCGSGIPVKPMKGEGTIGQSVILTTRFSNLAAYSIVIRNLVLTERRNTKLKEYIASVQGVRARSQAWAESQYWDRVIQAIQSIERHYVWRVRLRHLLANIRRAGQELQYRKEKAFYLAQRRGAVDLCMQQMGHHRSTRIYLLHQTMPLRRLHRDAWPELYPHGLPDLPALSEADRRRVWRSSTRWQDDLEIDGYPSIVGITPTKTPITSLTPPESSEPPSEPPSSRSSRDKSQSLLSSFWHKYQRKWGRDENGEWFVMKIISLPQPPDKPALALPEKRALAKEIAHELFLSTPLSLAAHSTSAGIGLALKHKATLPSTTNPAPTRIKRKYVNSDAAVMDGLKDGATLGSGATLGKRVRKPTRRG